MSVVVEKQYSGKLMDQFFEIRGKQKRPSCMGFSADIGRFYMNG